ncbi:hypothetical protein PBI_KEPLER_71 [Arthrobacter phage Kepler]|uniref:Uncharacterized protein n=1 Tax=Arthrobacter phage Kepler TaxID=2419959 RepID=A0A3G2KH46_9CAUD|nr:membrane protein [Arthrobacter phage Kepler]AYN58295.1 hypothetical protein PBI_KEPLER_71 [Arthrobacter phage Kepler]
MKRAAGRALLALLAVFYVWGMPVAFIMVELLAAAALGAGDPLAWLLVVIAVWNVAVLFIRASGLARVTEEEKA